MQAELKHSLLSAWWMAIRPRTLPAAASSVIAGSGIAIGMGSFSFLPALVALVCSLLLQIGANLVNDVADFQKGTDRGERLGPTRVTQSGLLSPLQVWMGAALVFAMAALGGIYLAWVAGWVVLVIGAACIAAAVGYTAGPFPLADHGWGDLFVGVFFGLLGVCGTVYVLTGQVPLSAWVSALAVGALTINILVVNNVRDIKPDRKAGRMNIPIRYGRRGGEIEYAVMLVVAYLCPLTLWLISGITGWPTLLPLITLPNGVKLYHTLKSTPQSVAMNRLLGQTANQLLFFSLLLAVGLALA